MLHFGFYNPYVLLLNLVLTFWSFLKTNLNIAYHPFEGVLKDVYI